MNDFIRYRILNNWSWIRILRLAIGVLVLFDGIMTKDNTFITLGIVLTLLPLMYSGGCGPANHCDKD